MGRLENREVLSYCPRCSAQIEFCDCAWQDRRPKTVLDRAQDAGEVPEDQRLSRIRSVLDVPRNWGYFKGHPSVIFTPDRQSSMLTEEYVYVDPKAEHWIAEKGYRLDGTSIPKAFHSYVGSPYHGRFRSASVMHDFHCSTKIRRWQDAHLMLYRGMMAAGVESLKAKFFYYAARHFGPKWGYYNDDMDSGQIKDAIKRDIKPKHVEMIAEWIAKRNPTIKLIDADDLSWLGIARQRLPNP